MGIGKLYLRSQLVLAWEDFDPDTGRRGDRLQTLSLTYHYSVQERIRLSPRYEQDTEERGSRVSNHRVILAAQYRFRLDLTEARSVEI